MKSILHWLIAALAVMLSSYLLPGIQVSGFVSALLVALVLGGLNLFIRPLLILLTLPINILTLGLFTFIINAALILLTSLIVPGFSVKNIWWAVLFSIVLGIINLLFGLRVD